ncbi:hypothetical protein BKA58DRAFT_405845 [Alternaria rosae]|uniref:uncharacterized protein n=1 Tax=Alternaria rosae TaxID=1187941 RepID=UPI001E8ED24B|nr:uncharacterized protein BKA58DRAFT_405845 [Alternaria rosae]KAH6859023.1 hypothetical protein BKA58DRAFT_405845 [Alternaria rosae]
MEPTPGTQHDNNAMASQADPKAHVPSGYPVAYFLCDGSTEKMLKTSLMLPRVPKLRKARIAGYRRSVRSGDGPNTLAFDAVNFGEWSGEEVVKGVAFYALNLEEERRVIEYAGGSGEVKQVVMEVACSSVLGLVGKMETVFGRIFVPEGDGDTLVGSEDSNRSAEDRNEDYIDEFSDDDFSETSSQATVEGHPTPRISPSISTLNDADIPHRSLDDLPLPAVDEHPVDPMIETTDWVATRQVGSTDVNWIEEPEQVQDVEITETVATTESYQVQVSEETEESDEDDQGTEDTQETDEVEGAQDKTETNSMDDTKSLRPSDFQRFLGAESGRALPSSPWQPTVPWRKESAFEPVRSHIVRAPSQFSGTETRRRKTSDSIKSLVDHFENLSPMSTPTKDGFSKEGSVQDGSTKDGSIKNSSIKDGPIKDARKDTDKGV